MSFLKMSNADVLFDKKIFIWKIYITNKALPISGQVTIVISEEFVIVTLDVNSKTFMVHVAIWEQEKMLMHSKKQA